MIQLCLSIWARSPRAYEQLRASGVLMLPSPSHLCRYKNTIPQYASYQDTMFRWMVKEAERENITPEGKQGGLIFDEMSIQCDLQFRTKRADTELVGLPELTDEAEALREMRCGPPSKLASHVLQLVFLGDTGFKFPIAHFPTCEAIPVDIYSIFWEGVNKLHLWGFKVNYSCMDGSSNNRAFLKMHFTNFNPATCDFVASNPLNPDHKVVMLMDPSHEIKNIRNSLLKSGGSKNIQHKGRAILWKYWQEAYEWDCTTNPMCVHHRLTPEALHPNGAEKMRNKLAIAVLSSDMLHLMEVYKESSKRTDLEAAIELLKNTSVIVSNFQDKRAVRTQSDPRLQQNREVLEWFIQWRKETSNNNNFLTRECYEDLVSMLRGFEKLVQLKLKNTPLGTIKPFIVNSDVVENMFCSQRGICNGSSNNPTYLQYTKGVNTIVIGQPLKSRKSNASSEKVLSGALPYKFHVNKSFKALRM